MRLLKRLYCSVFHHNPMHPCRAWWEYRFARQDREAAAKGGSAT